MCFPAPAGAAAPKSLRCQLRLSSQWKAQLLTPWAEQSASCLLLTLNQGKILSLPTGDVSLVKDFSPSKRDAVGGQQNTWHQGWQKGNLILSRAQAWAFNLQLCRGKRQAESLLLCDGQHWKLVDSHSWKNSPSLLADLHLYNMFSAYSSRKFCPTNHPNLYSAVAPGGISK